MLALDVVGQTPLADLTVAVCPYDRQPCAPLTADGGFLFPHGITDRNGWTPPIDVGLAFQQQAFIGYLDVRGPGIPDCLCFMDSPVVRSMSMWRVFVSRTVQAGVDANYGIQQDPADPRGNIWMALNDCTGTPSPGVKLTSSSPLVDEKTIVLNDGVDPKATSSGSNGNAGILNVRPGLIEIRASVAATGQPIATSQLLVRANSNTYVGLMPTPNP